MKIPDGRAIRQIEADHAAAKSCRSRLFAALGKNLLQSGGVAGIITDGIFSIFLFPVLIVAMPAEAAFIDALRDDPDDRTLCLVYADWLDERGDSRGELIRLQCELEGTPMANPRRHVLRRAIEEWGNRHQSEWLAPLRRRVLGWQSARMEFGLVENVTMSPAGFLKQAESGLFEEMPYLVGITLEGTEKPLQKVLDSPDLSRLKSLGLSVVGTVSTSGPIRQLASLKTLRHLTSLNLCNGGFGDEAISLLLQSDSFPRLRRLNLQNNSLTRGIAGPLIASPFVSQLEYLALGSRWDFGTNRLEDVGIRVFSQSPTPLRLRWLDLAANELSDSSAWDLSMIPWLDKIERLDLAGNRFGWASRNALEARFGGRVFHTPQEPACVCC